MVSASPCGFFGFSSFLPQAQNKHVRSAGDCKMSVGLNGGMSLRGPETGHLSRMSPCRLPTTAGRGVDPHNTELRGKQEMKKKKK